MFAPPASVASMIVFVQSWCWVMTSTPWSRRLCTAWAWRAGSHQLPVEIVIVSISGSTDWAPRVKALMFARVWGMGKA